MAHAVATRLLVMPKISKKSIQNGLPWLSSLAASAQVRLKVRARDLISFQDKGMGNFDGSIRLWPQRPGFAP